MKNAVSTGPMDRVTLLIELDRQMRQSSGLGVVFSQTVAERLGMASSDLECLDFIALRDVATAGELAEATGLTTGAVTGVIDRLEKAGFARRERDVEDRRKVLVRVLPAVERKIVPMYASLAQAMKNILSDYSDAEIALLHGFVSRAGRVMAEEIAKLRAKPSTKQKRRQSDRST